VLVDVSPEALEEGRRSLQDLYPSLHVRGVRADFSADLGVLGPGRGRLLAFLGGMLVARRAMRPIAGLTRAAREVARTRDPDITLPKPQANDDEDDGPGRGKKKKHKKKDDG